MTGAVNLAMRVLEITAKYDDHDLFWRVDGEYAPITMFAMCNDLFYWACADAEKITQDNIDEFEKAYKDAEAAFKHGGCYAQILFCCRVRSMRPQPPYYRNIPKEMHPLFDACGPVRTDLLQASS